MSYTLHKDTIKSLDIFQNMNPHIKHFREPSLFLTCCISSTESLNRQENNLFFFFSYSGLISTAQLNNTANKVVKTHQENFNKTQKSCTNSII